MLLRTLILAAVSAVLTLSAHCQPEVKIVNFTADWCPNCRILDPRIDEAISRFDGNDFEQVILDHSEMKGASQTQKKAIGLDLIERALEHDVRYLWDWYGGVTGIAVIVAADTGEPLSCIMRVLSTDDIEDRLKEGFLLATKGPPGARRPNGPDCPSPSDFK